MKKEVMNYLATILLLLSFSVCSAQVSKKGTPRSLRPENLPAANARLAPIPQFTVSNSIQSRIAAAQVVTNDPSCNTCKNGGNYGVGEPANIKLLTAGAKLTVPDGIIYSYTISSNGAKGLQLYFDEFVIPQGGELYIYNADKSMTLGAYTETNNTDGKDFMVQMIRGSNITIEYFEPKTALFNARISIKDVIHCFIDVYSNDKTFDGNPDYGDADFACIKDVACEPTGWEEEISSVGLFLLYNSTQTDYLAFFACTGTLMNNTKKDMTPYFLTATHCWGNRPRDPSNAGNVVVMFNYQRTICQGTSDNANTSQTLSGADIIVVENDAMLFRLHETPPASYRLSYAGWDNMDESAMASSPYKGIHHPNGRLKRISYTSTLRSSGYNFEPNYGDMTHWNIIWNDGVTTPGSSGSPLFDKDHKLIGLLHGGTSSCKEHDSPDNDNIWHHYGRYTEDHYSKLSSVWAGIGPFLDHKYYLPKFTKQLDTYTPSYPSNLGDVLTVDITFNKTTFFVGETITINSVIKGVIAPYESKWSLGDGSSVISSDGFLVNVLYTQPGTKLITATIEEPTTGRKATVTKNITILPSTENPVFVSFLASGQYPLNQAVNFNCFPHGGVPPYTYSYDFGDNTDKSTDPSPYHKYTTGGIYTVKVNVTDSRGIASGYQSCDKCVTIIGPQTSGTLKADFIINSTVYADPATIATVGTNTPVHFRNNTTYSSNAGSTYKFLWKFSLDDDDAISPINSTEQGRLDVVYKNGNPFNINLANAFTYTIRLYAYEYNASGTQIGQDVAIKKIIVIDGKGKGDADANIELAELSTTCYKKEGPFPTFNVKYLANVKAYVKITGAVYGLVGDDRTYPNIKLDFSNKPNIKFPFTDTYTIAIMQWDGLNNNEIGKVTRTYTIYSAPVNALGTNVPNADGAIHVCRGTVVQLGIAGITGITYNWSSNQFLSSATVSNPTFTATAEGYYTYYLSAKEPAAGCVNVDHVNFLVKDISAPAQNYEVTLGEEKVLDNFKPTGGTDVYSSYAWSPGATVSPANSPTPTFKNPGVGGTYDYTITITDSRQCKGTATASVYINGEAPGSLLAVLGPMDKITLNWQDNTTQETSYEIEKASSITGPFVNVGGSLPANTVTKELTGIPYYDTYYFRVKAIKDGVSIGTSNVATVTNIPAGAYSNPKRDIPAIHNKYANSTYKGYTYNLPDASQIYLSADFGGIVKKLPDGSTIIVGSHTKQQLGGEGYYSDFYIMMRKLDACGKEIFYKEHLYSGANGSLVNVIPVYANGQQTGFAIGATVVSDYYGNNGNSDYFVLLTDLDGNRLWEKSVGGRSSDHLKSLEQASNGDLVLGGNSNSNGNRVRDDRGGYVLFTGWKTFDNSVGFNYGNGIDPSTGGAYVNVFYDFWMVRLSLSLGGTYVMDKTYGFGLNNAPSEPLACWKPTSDGGSIAVGTVSSQRSLLNGQKSDQYFDGFMVKFNATGSEEWHRTIKSGTMVDVVEEVGNEYVALMTSAAAVGLDKTEPASSTKDYWVVAVASTQTIATPWPSYINASLMGDKKIKWQKVVSPGRGGSIWYPLSITKFSDRYTVVSVANGPGGATGVNKNAKGTGVWIVDLGYGNIIKERTFKTNYEPEHLSVSITPDQEVTIATDSLGYYRVPPESSTYSARQLTISPVSPLEYFPGQNIMVNVNASCVVVNSTANNAYIVQLSDASGSFAKPTVLFTYPVVSAQTTIQAYIPLNTTPGKGYRVRVITKNLGIVSNDNGDYITIKKSDIVTASPATLAYTIGQTISVPYTASGSFMSWNQFTLQLSDANGSFVTPYTINTITSSISGTISGLIPPAAVASTKYRVRVIGSAPVVIGTTNPDNISIGNLITTGPAKLTNYLGTSSTVAYNAMGAYAQGNEFIVQLSNASGVFTTTPLVIGRTPSTASGVGTIPVTYPWDLAPGIGYRVRIVSTQPAYTALDNGKNITLLAQTLSSPAVTVPTYLAGDKFNTYFYKQGGFGPENGFELQVSDEYGSFANPRKLVSFVNEDMDPNKRIGVSVILPTSLRPGTQYAFRVVATSPLIIGDVVENITIANIQTKRLNRLSYFAGATVPVSFASKLVFGASNKFTLQLSDMNGSFSRPTELSVTPGTVPIALSGMIPINTPWGSGYRVRVVSSSPYCEGIDNLNDIEVVPSTITIPEINILTCGALGGTPFAIPYTVMGGFANENAFTAQLIQGTTVTTIGVAFSNTSGTISAKLPIDFVPSACQIRVISSSPALVKSNVVLPNSTDRPTVVGSGESCMPGTYTLTASGGTGNDVYNWYASNALAAPLIKSGPTLSLNTAGQYNYYVSITTAQGCTTGRTLSYLRLYPRPTIAGLQVNDVGLCGAGTATITANYPGANSAPAWYTAPTGGDPMNLTSQYSASFAQTTTLYVGIKEMQVSGCESIDRLPVTVKVDNACSPRALFFDQGGSTVTVPTHPKLQLGTADFTVEAVIRATQCQLTKLHILSTKTSSTTSGFSFFLDLNGKLSVTTPGGTYTPGSADLRDNTCHHVAVVRKGTIYMFYVDANFVGMGFASAAENVSTNNPLIIGYGTIPTEDFYGLLDEVRVWNVARTQNDISFNRYTVDKNTPNLVANWKMNESSGNIVYDESINHLNGSFTAGRAGKLPARQLSLCNATSRQEQEESASTIESVNQLTCILSPNPSLGQTSIILKGAQSENFHVQVLGVDGRIYVEKEYKTDLSTFDLDESLPSGIYFVRISDGINTTVQSLVMAK